jgi:hypothetical protein
MIIYKDPFHISKICAPIIGAVERARRAMYVEF